MFIHDSFWLKIYVLLIIKSIKFLITARDFDDDKLCHNSFRTLKFILTDKDTVSFRDLDRR
jgi:hypothetical protein